MAEAKLLVYVSGLTFYHQVVGSMKLTSYLRNDHLQLTKARRPDHILNIINISTYLLRLKHIIVAKALAIY